MMGAFVGLDGVKNGVIVVKGSGFARTVTGILRGLTKDRVCSYASDNGSVTVWRCDDKSYRCDFSRWCVSHNSLSCKTKSEVKTWLKEWMPKCEGNDK